MNKILIRIVSGMIISLIAAMAIINTIVGNFWGLLFTDPNWYPIRHTATLIQYIIKNTPQDELFQEKDTLQVILDRQIDIAAIDDDNVPEKIKQQLIDGQLIYNTSKNGKKKFYVPTQNGSHVVIFDPSYQQYKPPHNPLSFLIFFLVVSAIAALVGFWLTYPIANRLNELEAASEKIRHGDISTRIQIISTDLIGSVRKCFNQMAGRIESLIMDRQNLLNAVFQNFQIPIKRIHNQLNKLHSINDIQEIKHKSRQIDQDINDIERLVNDILVNEKNRRLGHKEKPEENRTSETPDTEASGQFKNKQSNLYMLDATTQSMMKSGIIKFISRMSLGILIVLLSYQLIMLITPQIRYKKNSNPHWYPVRTVALLIQRAVDRTPEKMLSTRIDVLQKSLDRRIEILPVESMNSFIKTGEQNFSNQVLYGVYNGKKVFAAPVHAGNDIVMIDPAFSRFRWNPSILLHTFALAIEFFLTALFGIFLSLPIIRNLKKLMEGIERVRQNDLNARVNIPLNKPIGTIARCFNDMAERIQSLLEHQKHLIQAVAHEIRTPVSRIHFHLEMLADADDKTEIDHRAKDIEEEIEELSRLINELSMLSALKQPKKDLTLICLQAHDILSEVVAYYQKSNIQIEIILLDASGKSLEISANPVYFKRAIHNIVSNAVRHAKSKVTVRCETSSDTILIEICDDGPGIPQHARSIVFEPFTRIDNSRSRLSGGFGLGLTIVKHILSLHGGTISVASNFPQGAKITTYWPSKNPFFATN